jgi:hypothetical protein
MAAFVSVLKGLAYAAITFLCLIVGITVMEVRQQVKALSATANAAIAVEQVQANKAIVSISERANLTLKNLDYLILNAGVTANVARQASVKELAVLDQLNREVTETVANTNKTLTTTNDAVAKLSKDSGLLLTTTNDTVKLMQPTFKASTEALQSFNVLISNPDIPATIDNAKKTTAALTDTVTNADAMVVDAKDVWHKFLHPTWPHRIWSAIVGDGLPLATAVVK